jgi:hypothetical protein
MMANQELEGYYLPARNMKETLEEVEKLRDGDYYTQLVEKIVPMAEKYHISKIAELYRKLV